MGPKPSRRGAIASPGSPGPRPSSTSSTRMRRGGHSSPKDWRNSSNQRTPFPATLSSIMSARAIGNANISFGLVAIPVKLYSAANSSAAISFNMLHAKCGSRVKQQYICPKEDNVVVPREEMTKGYEFSKDQYVLFS